MAAFVLSVQIVQYSTVPCYKKFHKLHDCLLAEVACSWRSGKFPCTDCMKTQNVSYIEKQTGNGNRSG